MKFLKIRRRKPPEVRVLELIEKHIKLCVSASDELFKAVEAKMFEGEENADFHIKELYRYEEEADSVRREITRELAKGLLPPLSKGDLIRVIEELDMVADWSKDAGRILEITPTEEFTDELRKMFLVFAERVKTCVRTLSDLILLINTNYRKALDMCFQVEEIEKEIDVIFVDTLKILYVSNVSCQTQLLIIELAKALENMADCCENTADSLRIAILSTFH